MRRRGRKRRRAGVACVVGGIVCKKFEQQNHKGNSREGNGEKWFEIPPTGKLGSFAYSCPPADRKL